MITFEQLEAHAALTPRHEPRHRAPRVRLTERGGRVVTVLLTLALVAFVLVAGAVLGGAR